VGIDRASYSIEGTPYGSVPAVVAALASMPNLEAIRLVSSPDVAEERVETLVAAIRSAGIAVPIGMVGNEVFYK
jgi:hypothetical protein